MTGKIAWGVIALMSIGVAGYALALAVAPALRTDFVTDLVAQRPLSIYGHLVGGGLALVLGVFQFNRTLRRKYLNVHRWMGRGYIVACWVGGIAAFALALKSYGGGVTQFGFGMLAVCWLVSTSMAYVRIRAGDVARHQEWMIRSFALTLAAVTLRIYLPISQMQGIPFDEAFMIISWMCWVPNLVVAEWFVLAGKRKPLAVS